MIDETEVTYLMSLYKQKIEKNKNPEVMKSVHKKAVHTAKMLTCEMVEGQAPICYLVAKHDNVSKDNVKNLLHRCEKLYEVRSEVEKIFQNFIKLEYDPKFKEFDENKLT